jgi:hypothetical protein
MSLLSMPSSATLQKETTKFLTILFWSWGGAALQVR